MALEEIHQQQQLNDGSGEGNGTIQSRLDCSVDLSIVGQEVEQDENKSSDSEQLNQEDEEACRDQIQLRGLSYESGLQMEDSQTDPDKIYSVTPAEGQKPIGVLILMNTLRRCVTPPNIQMV